MVLFGNSNSLKPLEGDAPRLLRMTPLHHSLRVARPKGDRRTCNESGPEEDAQSDAGSTASAPGFTGDKDNAWYDKMNRRLTPSSKFSQVV
ncbi:hypothetical protein RUM44_005700 [Polyplax serrata]|uniref:Uncharacterized protein n=1 Tax=Polyplax serrata TaxID=468196 RepID=A0ABR1AWB4_POLSC